MSWLRTCATGRILQVAALAAILLACMSCASLEGVPATEVHAQQLIGWDIHVTTLDGQIHEFRLLDVTGDALIGESEQVRFDDVALLEWRDAKISKNPCFWVGVGAASLLLGLVWFAIELDKSI